MASPTMSYLICSMALIVLILVIPSFFEIQRNGIADEMTRRELTEIADYTSNTLANLFFLAESAHSSDIYLNKELLSLPLTVGDSFYVLSIAEVDSSLEVIAYIKDQQWISGQSWIAPGLDVDPEISSEINSYELNNKIAIASCHGGSGNFYISLGYGEK
jgi:hypothetical protein